IGPGKARELLFTARNIDGREAERIGLVNLAVPGDRLMDTAREMAVEIAGNSSFSIRMIKRGLQMAGEVSLEALMDYEIEACLACVSTSERRESLARFEGRKRT
ncbi:MAG: enoyl-CoA hydratase/isomerase family protein, partial [Proteobacteria bacterium]|nr:enoyl-CoA hydratase/isomerase family protein [Pseudomonadota bacterium]